MWLSIPIVLGLIAGIALSFLSGGIYGLPLLIVALLAGAGALVQRSRGKSSGHDDGTPRKTSGGTMSSTGSRPPAADEAPQDTEHAGRHIRTGTAHPGQEHMTG